MSSIRVDLPSGLTICADKYCTRVIAAGRTALLVALCALLALPARAQDWPAREVHVICGFPAGTGIDQLVRHFAERLAALAGKPFIVDNKPGALTTIAGEYVKNARPDGYTLYITGGNTSFASAPFLVKELRYDPVKDFTPVTTLGRLPFILAVSATSPVTSVAELTISLKAKDGRGFYGTSNAVAIAASERYAKLAGFKVDQVRYKSVTDVVLDVIRGQIDFVFVDGAIAQQHQDKLRALAVTPASRFAGLSHLPTMAEAGVPDYDITAWFGAWFPARTPPPIVDRTAAWFNQILATEETKSFIIRLGMEPWPGSPQHLAELVPKEIEKWGQLFKDANVQPE